MCRLQLLINCNVPAEHCLSHDFNMASGSTYCMHNVAEKLHQPRSFSFLKWEFGKKCIVKISFQLIWFDQWPWLDCSEENDSMFSHTCLRAKPEEKLTWSAKWWCLICIQRFYKLEGHDTKFPLHETLKSHKEVCLKVIITLPSENNRFCMSPLHATSKRLIPAS